LIISVRVLAALAWLNQLDLAGHWLQQYTAPVRAKPEGRPHLTGAHYKYPTSCSHLLNPVFPSRHTHTLHTPTNSPPHPGQVHWTVIWSQIWGPEWAGPLPIKINEWYCSGHTQLVWSLLLSRWARISQSPTWSHR